MKRTQLIFAASCLALMATSFLSAGQELKVAFDASSFESDAGTIGTVSGEFEGLIHRGSVGSLKVTSDEGATIFHFDGNGEAKDGEGQYLSIKDSPILTGHHDEQKGWDSLRISMSVKLDKAKLAQLLRKSNGSDEEGFMLFVTPSGSVGFQLSTGSTTTRLTSEVSIRPDGQWHQVEAFWDGRLESGANMALTIDGKTVSGRSESKNLTDTVGDLAIGAIQRASDHSRPAGQYFAGSIRDLNIGTMDEGLLASALKNKAAIMKIPPVFSDHMILQRQKPIPVWGWAGPRAEVVVTLGDSVERTTADGNGAWMVNLPSMEAGGPYEMTIDAGPKEKFSDVLIGEVWLCSGQSNMEWTLRNSDSYEEELAAIRENPPVIRQLKMNRIVRAAPDKMGSSIGWVENDRDYLSHFTAVGYHFARAIQSEIDVPIGLINSSWGGSKISPWIPREEMQSNPKLKGYEAWLKGADRNNILAKKYAVDSYDAWLASAKDTISIGRSPGPPPHWPAHPIHENRQTPTGMYNGMIAPVSPYGIRGVLFYQGESNREDRSFYETLLNALISSWRADWNDSELPFYNVQLAKFNYNEIFQSMNWVQDAQRRVAMKTPNTGMAVTTDISDVDDIHPRNKKEVGERLARWALSETYGVENIVISGPLLTKATLGKKGIQITFSHAEGLNTSDGNPPSPFEVAGEDLEFYPAEATIRDDSIILKVPQELVQTPHVVRFGWGDTTIPNLVNGDYLPASPFQEIITEK